MFLFSWTSLFFGYSFNEAYHTPECWVHPDDKLLLFSAYSAWHYFGIWVSFISQIIFLVFQWTKATPCVSSFFDNHMATLMHLHLWWMNGYWLIFCSLKFPCWFFWRALPQYQSWSKACLPGNTHKANREWGHPTPTIPL